MKPGGRLTIKLIAVQVILLFAPFMALLAYRADHLPRMAEEASRAHLRDIAAIMAQAGIPEQLPPGLDVAVLSDTGNSRERGTQGLLAAMAQHRRDRALTSGMNLALADERWAVVVRGNGQWIGVAEESRRIVPTLYPHIQRVAIIVQLTLFAAVLLSVITSWSILKPLLRLRSEAERAAEGQSFSPITVSGGDEVEEIARAINELLRKLGDQRDALVSYATESSHRMRTSLAAIKGGAEILRGDAVPEDIRRRFAGNMVTEADRMNQALRDTLTLARMESGEATLRLGPMDLCSRIREITDALQAMAPGVRIDISSHGPVRAEVDPDRFDEALSAIIENALKFSAPGGAIQITVFQEKDEAFVDVDDSGPGVPTSRRERIFDRFFTTGEPLPDGSPATGLGLSIARAIIQLHGGRIAAGESPFGGARMSVRIPLHRSLT